MQTLTDADPVGVKSALTDPKRKAQLWASFDEGLRSGQVGFVRLYFELLGYVGSQQDVVLVFLQSMGFTDASQLRNLVSRVAEAQGMDEDALAVRSERFLREYHARHGRKLMILDEAKEVESNGTAGPAGS